MEGQALDKRFLVVMEITKMEEQIMEMFKYWRVAVLMQIIIKAKLQVVAVELEVVLPKFNSINK